MICLAADKGGNFMATKIGLTVVNCVNPNSFESFDLFGSLESVGEAYMHIPHKYKAQSFLQWVLQ
jgi:hypothetical protein